MGTAPLAHPHRLDAGLQSSCALQLCVVYAPLVSPDLPLMPKPSRSLMQDELAKANDMQERGRRLSAYLAKQEAVTHPHFRAPLYEDVNQYYGHPVIAADNARTEEGNRVMVARLDNAIRRIEFRTRRRVKPL